VLTLIYWLVEIRGWQRWAMPFVVFGVNALALYFLSSLVARAFDLIHVGSGTVHEWLFTRVFAPWATPVNASLAYAVAYVLVWWGVMALLYRRRLFIRV